MHDPTNSTNSVQASTARKIIAVIYYTRALTEVGGTKILFSKYFNMLGD